MQIRSWVNHISTHHIQFFYVTDTSIIYFINNTFKNIHWYSTEYQNEDRQVTRKTIKALIGTNKELIGIDDLECMAISISFSKLHVFFSWGEVTTTPTQQPIFKSHVCFQTFACYLCSSLSAMLPVSCFVVVLYASFNTSNSPEGLWAHTLSIQL